MGFRRVRGGPTLNNTNKRLLSELLVLLVKVVGESVKDKMARALIIGVIASVGVYSELDTAPTEQVLPLPQVTSEAPALKLDVGKGIQVTFPDSK